MKQIIVALTIAITISSCGDGYNPRLCREQVETIYPKSTVKQVGDYRFIVIDSSKKYMVRRNHGIFN